MSGIRKSIGYADETTYGTFVPPTRHVPLIDESFEQEIERMESEAAVRLGAVKEERHTDVRDVARDHDE
jgi:hypothetical protein